ncbi:hypothetical protein E2C01_085767 [Portunus trituberculatus]|uniref:Uncharacterized protein n=1 Tax=Portunus trituberculatus TaxID=210409 RepID=A0A5B7JCT4_PORTR|nr:hypothetical protein [Portunus trituberculatus]
MPHLFHPPFHTLPFSVTNTRRPTITGRAQLKIISAREEGDTGGGGGGGSISGRPSSIQLIPGFLEVVDLLKNLPESSSGSSSFSQSSGRINTEDQKLPSVPPPPPPPSGEAAFLVASSVVSLQPGEGKAKTRIGKMSSPARRQKGQEAAESEVLSTVC